MVGVALVAFAFVQSCKKAESAAARPEEAAQAGRVTQIAGQRIDGGPTAYVWGRRLGPPSCLSARAYWGRMLWLRANRLPGSYWRFTAASRW